MGNGPAIISEGLTKFYGATRGVEGLDFEVHVGEVFGYLGPNGAGKTTTIRTAMDFLRPTRGHIRILGLDSHASSLAIKHRIGYLPGDLALYDRLTGAQYLDYFAKLRGGVGDKSILLLSERLQVELRVKIRSLSHGNRQKIGLIQAFMHEPELLVLDEPTQGLDPLIQQEFYGLIEEARDAGRTTFISSHVLPEVERLCDRVAVIREGRLIAVQDVGDLKSQALRSVEFHFEHPVAASEFEGLPGVRDVASYGDTVRCTIIGSMDPLIKAAAKFSVVNIATEEASLEDVFLAFYERGDRDVP
jgi:ABC-2 type transport system ATP-binding protein